MLDKWHKKEKPVFTGITRGVGGLDLVLLLVVTLLMKMDLNQNHLQQSQMHIQ